MVGAVRGAVGRCPGCGCRNTLQNARCSPDPIRAFLAIRLFLRSKMMMA